MSRAMKHFADYFMQGLQLGGGWAEKWQAQQIAKERAKLKDQADKVRADREERKLGIYAEGVRANAEAARARAYRTMNPVAKGGGKGGAAGSTPADVSGLLKEATDQGIIATPTPVAPQTNITVTGSSDGADNAPLPDVPLPPGEEGGGSNDGEVETLAEGGIVGGMSLEEAQRYMPSSGGGASSARRKPASSPFSAAMSSAAGKYKAPEEKKDATPDVRPTGPVGSGSGGSYTTADVQPGGVLDVRYRAGGMVRKDRQPDPNISRAPEDTTGQDERYISGAPKHVPHNDSGAWYAEGGTVRYAKDEDRLIEPRVTPGMVDIPIGRGRASLGATYDPTSRYGAVEGGYEHPVGRSTTLGVHGNIGKDLGPEGASARPDWGVGVRGRIRFQEGGAVSDSQDLTRSYDYKTAEKERETQQRETKAQDTLRNWEQEYESRDSTGARRGAGSNAASSFASGFESGSANGATGSGGDAAGGVSGSGGIGGSATGGQGGSAAAGVGGEDGGTYRRGGRVRRFQSGGVIPEQGEEGDRVEPSEEWKQQQLRGIAEAEKTGTLRKYEAGETFGRRPVGPQSDEDFEPRRPAPRVRRFQSGGRVMEAPTAAIDTGTSGPGSGYGYRAAPPARRY